MTTHEPTDETGHETTGLPTPRRIDAFAPHEKRFSICTLVTKPGLYDAMRRSFADRGFAEPQDEYLCIDNTEANTGDGYEGLARMIAASRGAYAVLVHQDVELMEDGADELAAALAALTEAHPRWALAGNSGIIDGEAVRNLADPYGDERPRRSLPAEVTSLDENFIVLRRDACLAPSADLSGFHLYGTDLCLQAEARGRTAHVIDFRLRHLGGGTLDPTFWECREALEAKFARFARPRDVRTPCTTVRLRSGEAALRRAQAARDANDKVTKTVARARKEVSHRLLRPLGYKGGLEKRPEEG